MTRTLAVKRILEFINEDDVIVSSTGFISRELFAQKDRELNFYMMGSMGNALAIGAGIAMNIKNRVFVISGDGAALMSLGSFITCKRLKLTNLMHFIIDNNSHESTGGQKTNSHLIDFKHLCPNTIVYRTTIDLQEPPRITLSPKQITERFKNALFRLKK